MDCVDVAAKTLSPELPHPVTSIKVDNATLIKEEPWRTLSLIPKELYIIHVWRSSFEIRYVGSILAILRAYAAANPGSIPASYKMIPNVLNGNIFRDFPDLFGSYVTKSQNQDSPRYINTLDSPRYINTLDSPKFLEFEYKDCISPVKRDINPQLYQGIKDIRQSSRESTNRNNYHNTRGHSKRQNLGQNRGRGQNYQKKFR
jgi:hypothetical protein